jgi:hypothetical protein
MRELDDLLAWMRENGVQHARFGDLELSLGEAPAPEPTEEEKDDRWEKFQRQVEADPRAHADEAVRPGAYRSNYEDPDLYQDGKVPSIYGHSATDAEADKRGRAPVK